jgi:uncharacterized protein (TIGR02246 family)
MSYRSTLALLAGLAFLACGEPPADEAAPAAETAASPDEVALQELGDYWETHYNMQHADMVASVYGEEAWSLPADGAYHSGRAAIEASLAATMAAAPTAEITNVATRVFGDAAMSMGSYAVEAAPEGAESMAFSGSYMNIMSKIEGEWKIIGSLANYDAEPPEGWVWADPMEETPEVGGENQAMASAYAEAWNAGDVSAILGMYAQDAMVSYSNGPIVQGHDALQADLEARMMPGASINIVNVGTMDFGDGWMADGGWYQIDGPDGAGPVQSGWYLNLLGTADDGSRMLHWTITNGRPEGGM